MSDANRHLVVTLHGIRTYGRWQEGLEKILKEAKQQFQSGQIEFEHYSYGVFDLLKFIIPFARNLAVKKFRLRLQDLIGGQQYESIDIVAHSFGTYLAIRALQSPEFPADVRIRKAILCGSVLPPDESLSHLVGPNRRIGRLINDCGTQDGVLLLTLFVWGVGMAGRLGFGGFQGGALKNRFFRLDHSGYFKGEGNDRNAFMRRWWVPVLLSDDSTSHDERPSNPGLMDRIWHALGANGAFVTFSFYTFMLLFIGGSLLGLWRHAEHERETALHNYIVQAASVKSATDPTTAALLLAELENPASSFAEALWDRIDKLLFFWREVNEEPDGGTEVLINRIANKTIVRSTLRGHEGPITELAIAPGSKFIASASKDGTARIWNADGSGEPIELADRARAAINRLAFTDGSHVVTASDDGAVRRWKIGPTPKSEILGTFSSPVIDLSYNWNGRLLAAASEDGTLRIWDTFSSPKVIFDKRVHNGPISTLVFSPIEDKVLAASPMADAVRIVTPDGSVSEVGVKNVRHAAFSPDGKHFVTLSGHDGLTQVWDTETLVLESEELKRKKNEECQRVGALHANFSPDGQRIAIGAENCNVEIWKWREQPSWFNPDVLQGHQGWVRFVTFSPDGNRVISASDDQTVRTWRLGESQPEHILTGYRDWVTHIAFLKNDGSLFVSASKDGNLTLWDLNQETEPTVLKGHKAEIWIVAVDTKRSAIMSSDRHGNVRIRNLEGKDVRHLPPLAAGEHFLGAELSARGRFVTVGDDRIIRVRDIDNPSYVNSIGKHDEEITMTSFSKFGDRIVTASKDNTARIWSLKNAKTVVILPHKEWVWSAEFSNDGRLVATACRDGVVRIWNANEAGNPIAEIRHDKDKVDVAATRATFSPDDEFLATSGYDTVVRVWTRGDNGWRLTEKVPQELRGHRNSIWGLAFSPDGKLLASASDDHDIWVWRLNADTQKWEAGYRIAAASPHRLTRLIFTPNSQRIIAADRGGEVRIWRAQWKGLVAQIRSRTKSCLSIEDRKLYLLENTQIAEQEYRKCERNNGRDFQPAH